jgi:tetratricopeptide (TPR) repeat protein
LKGDIISWLALRNQESFVNALMAYEEAIAKFEFNLLARCGKCIALNSIGQIYYSRKAYRDAVSFANLLNQNTPYIDAFEWPRYWRSSSKLKSWTNLYPTSQNHYVEL